MCACRQLSAEEVCDVMFPSDGGKGYVGIYKCFMDDSKDANQSQMFVCAGWVGERTDWLHFIPRWNKRLAKDGLDYYKTSEYKMLTGQFAVFRRFPKPYGRSAASALRQDLLSIIKDYANIRWVGTCVPMDEWNAVASRPEAVGILEHPYRRAIESVWTQTVWRGFIKSKPHRNSRIAFVHDDGPDLPELVMLYSAFKILNPKTAKYLVGFSGLCDKDVAPLQAADLVANHTLELGLKWMQNGKTVNEESELQSTMGFLGVWREKYARAVLHHELERRGLPIPDDLEDDYSEFLDPKHRHRPRKRK